MIYLKKKRSIPQIYKELNQLNIKEKEKKIELKKQKLDNRLTRHFTKEDRDVQQTF